MLKAFDFYEGNLKRIWTDGRNLMDSVTAEQVTFIHESLRYAEAEREFDDVCPPLRTLWPEEEAAYDLGLSKWNVFVNEAVTNHKVFRNYMEAWEKVKVNKKHEMFKLLEKYKRMIFFDKDEKNEDCDGLFMILSRNLEWFKRGRGTEAGWRVLAMPLSKILAPIAPASSKRDGATWVPDPRVPEAPIVGAVGAPVPLGVFNGTFFNCFS